MAEKAKAKKKDHLSYSALGNFEKCPRGYWETFHGNFEDKASTKTLLIGQLFHKYIETLGDEAWINNWIEMHDNSRDFFMKSKPTQMYVDFIKAMNSAEQFLELDLYDELPSTSKYQKDVEELKETGSVEEREVGHVAQEVRLEGSVSDVPFVGIIDMLTVKDGEIYIRDWKHIKDFKRVYNEVNRCYEEWYEKYIQQQMLYAFLLFSGDCTIENKGEKEPISFPEINADMPINCEIVGISKGGEITVKRIKFAFENIDELMNSATWSIVSSKVRYAWGKLNKITEKTKGELSRCGECAWCRANHVVLEEEITIE